MTTRVELITDQKRRLLIKQQNEQETHARHYEKIATKQKLRNDRLIQINQLHDALEEATAAGDAESVRENQAEIAAREAIVAAIDKEILDLWNGKSAECIALELASVDEKAKFIEKKSAELNRHIAKTVCPALETFIAALTQAESISNERIEAIRSVTRRLPKNERERLSEYCSPDTLMGAAIEDALLKAGIFTKIASAPWIILRRNDLTDISGLFEKRSDYIMGAVWRAVDITKQALLDPRKTEL